MYDGEGGCVGKLGVHDVRCIPAVSGRTTQELERHFESAHLNYLQNTDKRTEEFKKLTKSDGVREAVCVGCVDARVGRLD